jgi:hypothetical protein
MTENFEDLVQGAEEALEHRDDEEARKRLSAALTAKPYPCAQKARIHRRLGEIAYRAGDLPAARMHLTEAEEGLSRHCCNNLDQDAYVTVLLTLAHIHRDLGEKPEMTEALTRARWKREILVQERWRPAHQIILVVMALLGMFLAGNGLAFAGVNPLRVVGFLFWTVALVTGFLAGGGLAIALESYTIPRIAHWQLKRSIKRLGLRNPISLQKKT